ncbi:hypothetical protein [Alteromonas gracilis]|uniref:hypothetical protein n=1 Tax=Alteromonas gracilis TaxID=1479524 RepID=UPI003219084D
MNLILVKHRLSSCLPSQLIAVARDAEGNVVDSTRVQIPRVLDYLYTRNESDADEAQLGVKYSDGSVTASVWAPTAQSVNVKVYNKARQLQSTAPMTLDSATGIWQYTGEQAGLDRQFYRYELTVYHPLTQNIEVVETTDPYSISLSTNGRFTQFVNLDDADLKPSGWDGHTVLKRRATRKTSLFMKAIFVTLVFLMRVRALKTVANIWPLPNQIRCLCSIYSHYRMRGSLISICCPLTISPPYAKTKKAV